MLRSVILVLRLSDEAFAGIVISLAGAATLVFNLVASKW